MDTPKKMQYNVRAAHMIVHMTREFGGERLHPHHSLIDSIKNRRL